MWSFHDLSFNNMHTSGALTEAGRHWQGMSLPSGYGTVWDEGTYVGVC